MNLEDTWTNCLAMWKWIAEQVKSGEADYTDAGRLKRQWLVEHKYVYIYLNCFFCDYVKGYGNINCEKCPGALVDKSFRCGNILYDYICKPIKFYEKLVELNKKRCLKKNTSQSQG